MIRYRLKCAADHGFDAWFRSSDDCDKQISAGLVTCPSCASGDIHKALMAPPVRTTRARSEKATRQPVETSPAPAAPVMKPAADKQLVPASKDMAKLVEMMRAVRETVVKSADYVGPQFADEARRIHFGEADDRGIYGEATSDEVEALHEDGIDVMPLPVLPEERN